jgi:hypothetical protein
MPRDTQFSPAYHHGENSRLIHKIDNVIIQLEFNNLVVLEFHWVHRSSKRMVN